MNWAWPAAFAFVGLCAAFAYGVVHSPPSEKTPQLACIEQRGEWVGGGWGGTLNATCKFPSTATAK